MHPTRRDGHEAVSAQLRERMSALLERAQREYPEAPAGPDDNWWQPAYLGGGAPLPAGTLPG
jgi:hypothetical protein